jgi:hypothetical protein
LKIVPPLLPTIAFSAGTIISTVEDMAKWDAALYGEKLLKKASLEKCGRPPKQTAANLLPLITVLAGSRKTIAGGGSFCTAAARPGFSSSFYRFVDDKLSVVVLTNHSDRIVDQLAVDIAGIYSPELKRLEGKADPNPQTSQKLKVVMSELLNGKHDPALFTPAMRVYLTTSTGKGFWQWFAAHGKMSSFTFSDREDKSDSQTFSATKQF